MYADNVVARDEDAYAVQTKRQTQVEEHSNGLEKALAILEETAHRLDEYLSKVLRPEDDQKAMGEPEEVLVPLAEGFRTWTKKARRIDAHLNSIISRLEL